MHDFFIHPFVGGSEKKTNKLNFACKLFFDSVLCSPDPIVQYYRFIHGVHHVFTGLYPVPTPVAVYLACLQFRSKFGEACKVFRSEIWRNRVVEFARHALFRPHKPSGWSLGMDVLFKKDIELRRMGGNEARHASLPLIVSLPLEGSTLFHVVREPRTPHATAALLAVSGKGILLYPLPPASLFSRPKSLTGSFRDEIKLYADMLRWEYVASTLLYVAMKVENPSGGPFLTSSYRRDERRAPFCSLLSSRFPSVLTPLLISSFLFYQDTAIFCHTHRRCACPESLPRPDRCMATAAAPFLAREVP